MTVAKKSVVLSTLLAFTVGGCATKTGTGAVVGGVGGAAVGGLIGSASHGRAGEGALIGGAVGALGGALVGHSMDKADEKKREEANSSSRYRERGDEPSTYNTYNASSNRITNLTVMDWKRQGVKDDIIIDRIQRSGQTFVVSASDERDLRNAGVSPAVIDAMRNAR
jgi:uncharacterized protein YcfJ